MKLKTIEKNPGNPKLVLWKEHNKLLDKLSSKQEKRQNSQYQK